MVFRSVKVYFYTLFSMVYKVTAKLERKLKFVTIKLLRYLLLKLIYNKLKQFWTVAVGLSVN